MRGEIYKNLRVALLHHDEASFLPENVCKQKVYRCVQNLQDSFDFMEMTYASFDRCSCKKQVFSCTDIYWTKYLKPLESMQEFVFCYYHNVNFGKISVRLGLWYLHLICQVSSVPSVTALYIWHAGPLKHGWTHLLCQYCTLLVTLLYMR